jgi:hypothetical protein
MPLKRAHGSPPRERQHTRKQQHHHRVIITPTTAHHHRHRTHTPLPQRQQQPLFGGSHNAARLSAKIVLLLPAPRQLQATVILWHGYGDLFVLETLSALKCCEHISVSSLLATSPIPFWHIQLDQDRSATRTSLCLVACYEVALVQFLPLTRF